jgi:hypothetical protein
MTLFVIPSFAVARLPPPTILPSAGERMFDVARKVLVAGLVIFATPTLAQTAPLAIPYQGLVRPDADLETFLAEMRGTLLETSLAP